MLLVTTTALTLESTQILRKHSLQQFITLPITQPQLETHTPGTRKLLSVFFWIPLIRSQSELQLSKPTLVFFVDGQGIASVIGNGNLAVASGKANAWATVTAYALVPF